VSGVFQIESWEGRRRSKERSTEKTKTFWEEKDNLNSSLISQAKKESESVTKDAKKHWKRRDTRPGREQPSEIKLEEDTPLRWVLLEDIF